MCLSNFSMKCLLVGGLVEWSMLRWLSARLKRGSSVALRSQAAVPEACVPALAATSPDACALPQGSKNSVHPASPDSAPREGPDRTVTAHAPHEDAAHNTTQWARERRSVSPEVVRLSVLLELINVKRQGQHGHDLLLPIWYRALHKLPVSDPVLKSRLPFKACFHGNNDSECWILFQDYG